mmetsp:Transcript_6451/g.17993  ORF Transcript_6451/g.17993 Transcript_6451/m.17993 type:complete len:239 (+) Transcript_6451:1617-2333(+)
MLTVDAVQSTYSKQRESHLETMAEQIFSQVLWHRYPFGKGCGNEIKSGRAFGGPLRGPGLCPGQRVAVSNALQEVRVKMQHPARVVSQQSGSVCRQPVVSQGMGICVATQSALSHIAGSTGTKLGNKTSRRRQIEDARGHSSNDQPVCCECWKIKEIPNGIRAKLHRPTRLDQAQRETGLSHSKPSNFRRFHVKFQLALTLLWLAPKTLGPQGRARVPRACHGPRLLSGHPYACLPKE